MDPPCVEFRNTAEPIAWWETVREKKHVYIWIDVCTYLFKREANEDLS